MNAADESEFTTRDVSQASGRHGNNADGIDGQSVVKTETCNSGCDLFRSLLHFPAVLVIGAVKTYQYLISPWLGPRCRFYPSCSQYFIRSVEKFGVIRGCCKGTARICRCHPWHPGGYDPP